MYFFSISYLITNYARRSPNSPKHNDKLSHNYIFYHALTFIKFHMGLSYETMHFGSLNDVTYYDFVLLLLRILAITICIDAILNYFYISYRNHLTLSVWDKWNVSAFIFWMIKVIAQCYDIATLLRNFVDHLRHLQDCSYGVGESRVGI